MNKSKKLIAICIIITLGYIYASPYLTAYNIRNAAQAKNHALLSSYVDFPVLKENLKETFTAQINTEILKEQQNNPFAKMGMNMVNTLINPMIDNFVSPKGLAMLMNGNHAQNQENHNSDSSSDTTQEADNKKIDVNLGYESFSRFVIKISNKNTATLTPEQNTKTVSFVLYRYNLVFWKLSQIRLPEKL